MLVSTLVSIISHVTRPLAILSLRHEFIPVSDSRLTNRTENCRTRGHTQASARPPLNKCSTGADVMTWEQRQTAKQDGTKGKRIKKKHTHTKKNSSKT